MTEEYRHIGKPTPRKDAVGIVTGKAEFTDDIRPDRTLVGRALRSPLAHARIGAIETAEAKRVPGVKAVLTHENVPPWLTGMPKHWPVLDSKVRFVGDAVALVAAETEEAAQEALRLIKVEYGKLPAVFDPEEAIKEGAPQLHEAFPNNIVADFPAFGPNTLSEIRAGDVEKGLAEADFIGQGSYGYDCLANPLPIEPPGVIARWEDEKSLTVWSGTQSASWHRWIMQSKMGFPDIRAITTHCGGSFGSKNYNPHAMLYAAALAKETGLAVKFNFTKEEHFGAFVLRLGSRFKGRIGMKKDGTITAVAGDWLVDTGASSDMAQAQVAVGCGEAQLLLRCDNWELTTKLVVTNRCPSGVIRGFGGQELEASLAPILADLMARAGLDPLDFFKKNYVRPGEEYVWRDGIRYTCRGKDYTAAMEEGARAFGWRDKWRGWFQPTAVEGTRRVGVGVGVHGNADVGEDDSEAYVRLNPDGTATIHASVAESGMGQRSSLCKMAAEVLGLDLNAVSMTPPDTLVNPFDFGLVGSRGTYTLGSAIIDGAEKALAKLFEKAAPRLKADPADLTTRDGRVFSRTDPEKAVSWSSILGPMETVTGLGHYAADYSIPNFLIQFVQVTVDLETGQVILNRVVSASDVGRIIDPPSLEAQLFGALGSAGLDTALFEETVFDPKTGRMLNMNMADYKWRTFNQLPEMANRILETPFPTHRFKAIGLGEVATSPGPGAVQMAVSNALGKHLTVYPLTPEVILDAVGQGAGGAA